MLRAESIEVEFGAVKAVDGVSLDVGDDEIVGLIGPNGSGKTTFLNALCGVTKAHGRLEVAGYEVRLGSTRAAVRAGIGRVFQAPQTYLALSALENVMIGSADHHGRGLFGATLGRQLMWGPEHRRWARARDALAMVGLADVAAMPAALLTYGQCRLVDIARALVGEPRILLLDEPSAGLNDNETTELVDLLARVHAEGVPILVIEHKIDFLDRLCDQLVVLNLGRVIASGPRDEIWKNEEVMNAYLGTSVVEG